MMTLVFGLFVGGMIFFAFPAISSAATYSWDDGAAGNSNWSDCDNWTSNTCPGSADIAQFDSTSNASATLDPAFAGSVQGVNITSDYSGTITQQIDTLTIGTANFAQGGGTWEQGTTTFDINDGDFVVSGGTFNAGAGTSTIGHHATISGGTVTASSARIFEFDGSSNDASVVTCTGDFPYIANVNTASQGADFTIGAGCAATSSSITLGFNADLTINGTSTYTGSSLTTEGEFTVNSGGYFNAPSVTTLDINFSFTNSGTVNTPSLTAMNIERNYTNTGTFNDNSLTTIVFDGNFYHIILLPCTHLYFRLMTCR